jgi:hypothetical protein
MIPKSGNRFSEKIMLKQGRRADDSKKHHPALRFKRDVRRPDAQKQQAERSDPCGIEKIRHADMMPDKWKFTSA